MALFVGFNYRFVVTGKKRSKLGNTDSIKFYLYKSLRRKLVRQLKKESKYSDSSIKGEFELELSPEVKIISEPDQKVQQELLEDAFNRLPVKQKEAVLLYFYEGLSYKEIASIMKMTKTKSARALLYRAIDTLNSILKENKSKISTLTNHLAIISLFF